MGRKLVLGIDFDGTIAETIVNVLQLLNRRHGKNLSLNDVKKYLFNDIYGISKEELNNAYAKVLLSGEDVALVDDRIPEIIRGFDGLFDVYVVTASLAGKGCIEEWLDKKGIRVKGIAIVKSKAEFKEGDVFIDDSPFNAQYFSGVGKRIILLKRPYYSYGAEMDDDRIIKAENWKEAEARAVELAKDD